MTTLHLLLFRSLLRERTTNPRVSASNPPLMPDAKILEPAARRLAPLALAELSISSSASPPRSNLPALVRRCTKMLPFLISGDANLSFRCCEGLVASLGAILSREPSPSLLPAIEVFAESLVSSDQLMSSLVKASINAPEESMMFTDAPPWVDEHIMLELVCCHFISSLLDEGAFEVFLSALSRPGRPLQPTPEIGFQEVLALVQRTWFFSLPAVVQAHLLLLMTRCTSVQNLNLHMLAFEYAMKLYVRYLPALSVFNRIVGAKAPLISFGKKIPFSCIKDTTEQKLRSQIDGLLLFCQSNSGDDLPIDDSDIDRVIEENQHMFHKKFRQQCTVIVKGILSSIDVKQKEVLGSDAEVSGDIICLAAALRVMASLAPHILHHFSQMKSATDNEYNDIYKIISLLGQHETNVLHRYVPAVTGKPVANESASMLMLDHFASLSACCLRRRFGFLWKGCITMMVMATNLIAEEQSLSTFHLPMDASEDSAVSCNTAVAISEVSARTKEIILRYKNIRRSPNNGRHSDGISLGTPDEERNSRVGKANGLRFLECHPEYSGKNWDDLLDCIECEEGKDYSNALKQRRKFNKFKDEKFLNQKPIRESTIEFLGVKSKSKRQQSTIEFLGLKSRSKRLCDH